MATTERSKAPEAPSAACLTAGYIENMVGEMEQLAVGEGLEALSFLLARAKEEAKRAAA